MSDDVRNFAATVIALLIFFRFIRVRYDGR